MRRNILFFTVSFLLINTCIINAQINFQEPEGGWTYFFDCDTLATDELAALDGTWSHVNSDHWDLSEFGSGNLGGVTLVSEDGMDYLRIQDPGWPDAPIPSNRKICFTHPLSKDGQVSGTYLDEGFTLATRIRLATEGVDDLYLDGKTVPFPMEGDGYHVDGVGKGMFYVWQNGNGSQERFGFSLISAFDDIYAEKYTGEGLIMNSRAGTIKSQWVPFPSPTLTMNWLNFDPKEWHELLIQIRKDENQIGTHLIQIWVDGGHEPWVFYVTSGCCGGIEVEEPHISFGVPFSIYSGAFDIDYIAYKTGLTDTSAVSRYDLATSVAEGKGTVTPESGDFLSGQIIKVNATPETGWLFDHWSGDLSGSYNPKTIRITGNMNISAHFVQDPTHTTQTEVKNDPEQISYFYNPVQKILLIETDAYEKLHMSIYSIDGKILLSKKWNNITQKEIPLGEFKSGIYLIQFRFDGKSESGRLVIR